MLVLRTACTEKETQRCREKREQTRGFAGGGMLPPIDVVRVYILKTARYYPAGRRCR